MSVVAEYRYFEIHQLPKSKGRKTYIYGILNRTSGGLLGEVRWYGPWRQYCFFPAGETVWSTGCLKDVEGFMEELRLSRVTK